MTGEMIKVLLVEDNEADARYIQELLAAQERPAFQVRHACDLAEGLRRVAGGGIDVVLLDLGLPDSQGLLTLERMTPCPAPVVVLTGLDDERLGIAAMEMGAQDYLVKGQVDEPLLVRAVRYAIERHRQWILQQETSRALDAKNLVLDELKELNEMKSRFIEVVTHEMRTPMTAVLCAVDLLIDGSLGQVSENQHKYLELVARNIDRLARFSTEVLRLSRLDADRYELMPVESSLRDVLTPVVELLDTSARRKAFSLCLEGSNDGAGVEVFADPDGVSQVITNLVSNAMSHCPAGTNVVISWAPKHDGMVEVTVSDDGPGIEQNRLDKIFDRFYQANHRTGAGYKGSGIGLSVCHGLVEKMGGRIVAESAPGEGSTFRFTLPGVGGGDEILFGKLAVKMGYVSPDQLQRTVVHQHDRGEEHVRLGELLLEQKLLSRIKLEHVLGWQDVLLSRPHPQRQTPVGESLLGRLAVEHGHLSKEQLNRCVWLQELRRSDGRQPRLGQVMVEEGLVTEDDVVQQLDIQQQQIAN